MVIRAALHPRMSAGADAFTRVPNAAIVPLDPEAAAAAAARADLGGGAATQAS